MVPLQSQVSWYEEKTAMPRGRYSSDVTIISILYFLEINFPNLQLSESSGVFSLYEGWEWEYVGWGWGTHLPDAVCFLCSPLCPVRRLCGVAPWRTENQKLNRRNELENTPEHSNTWNVPRDFTIQNDGTTLGSPTGGGEKAVAAPEERRSELGEMQARRNLISHVGHLFLGT